ncbi:hypothetical protein C9J41_19155 [Photobacterium sp. GB-50]|uniref:hypothetical protein n=1 Tax=Photobacterium sp. GB-50 TaxID=2022107 RepID=UPI000D15C862|nr:hypothetical protein [Photobacterium sp. GB-50]PSW71890.1 hypothetical protein C9J41_19155 [Photobacterium sp. GB-50]
MTNNTFRLAEHYTPIRQKILDSHKDMDTLHNEYGELVDECLFLSRLIENLKLLSCTEKLLSIASPLIEFELPQFRPHDLVPIYEGESFFRGEIIYYSDNVLVLKVTSNQFPIWEILLTVVTRVTSTVLPNFELKTHFEFSAVTL